MKILYVTTIGNTMSFFRDLIRELIMSDNTVDIASNDTVLPVNDYFKELGCTIHTLACQRNPFDKNNLKAIKQIEKLLDESHYDIVHCHTPIASLCARIACRKARRLGTKVFYTAHGFHFYKGAPLINWLIYYPIEKICAYFTDTLIAINQEDYNFAKKYLKAKDIRYVPGVGIDIEKFAGATVNRSMKRSEIDVPDNAFLLLSTGELNHNKNHEIVLRALANIPNKDIHYAIAGNGRLHDYLLSLANELGVADRFHLLGKRRDIPELNKAANVSVFPSIREGLGLAAIEGMACGLPLIVSDNRGSRDYSQNNVNAIVCPYNDANAFADAIIRLYNDRKLCEDMGKYNVSATEKYSVKSINEYMISMYKEAGN